MLLQNLLLIGLIYYLSHAASVEVSEDSWEREVDEAGLQKFPRTETEVEAQINQSATLSCKSPGEPVVPCFWLHGEFGVVLSQNNHQLNGENFFFYGNKKPLNNKEYRVTFSENGHSCNLFIHKVKDFDAGEWRCRFFYENLGFGETHEEHNEVINVRIGGRSNSLDLKSALSTTESVISTTRDEEVTTEQNLPKLDPGHCERKCRTEDHYGQQHEACPGSTSVTKCPDGSSGTISFECVSILGGGIEGRLNFSNCSSNWITELWNFTGTSEINATDAEDTLKKIKSNLENSFNSVARVYGHEIEKVLVIVDHIVDQTQKNIQSVDESEKIVETSIGIFGSLANETNNTWGQLDEIKRASVATLLFTTIENTAFTLTNSSGNSSRLAPGYMKTFNQSNDLTVVVGTLRRSDFDQESSTRAEGLADFSSDLQLPADWQKLVPGIGDIQFVQMKMATKLIDNIIPPSNGQHDSKSVNSQLTSFTVANSNGTVALKFTGPGIRITFQHTGKAWGSEESTIVPRRLHDGEQAKAVLGSGVCVYWDTHKSNWSTDGCEKVESNRTFTICECQHLTAFAVLMSMHKYTSRDIGLTVTTISLCSLSMIGLLATILIFQTFPTARNKRTSITIQLCGCLLLGNVLILTIMDRNNFALPDMLCSITGMLSHFVFLSAFTWMAIEGYVVYKMVTSVFVTGVENKIRLKLLGYGIPCFIVGGMIGFHLYATDPSYGGDLYCWLEGDSIWAFIGPVLLVTAGNVFVLITALIKAFKKNNITSAKVKHSGGRATSNMIIGTLSLTCILGITWIFGFFLTASHSQISAYVFTVFNASQGIFIFIFHCWMNKQVRKAIRRKIAVWTSGSFPTDSSNSRLQVQKKAGTGNVSAKRKKFLGLATRADKRNLNSRSLQDAAPQPYLMPTLIMATLLKAKLQNTGIEDEPMKQGQASDSGIIDSDFSSEAEDELLSPPDPILIKYTSNRASDLNFS